MLDDILVMVLAGGVGERLYPLTKERAKPAVYFGGPYRIIDFTLSNCINSGLRKIFIALQYKSLSLGRHIRMGWSVVADELGEFIEIPSEEAYRFGVMQVDDQDRLVGFLEKPKNLAPGGQVLASMGIYIFDVKELVPVLEADARRSTTHDFGKDIIPELVTRAPVYAYRFSDENKKEAKYWRDIGTLDAYYEANMDLCRVNPDFNLYDPEWPLRTHQVQAPPAKFVFADEGRRCGQALDSIISAGCIISGSRISGSVLCPNVRVHSFCTVEQSILMPGVRVGRHARIRRAIIDRDVLVPRGALIGFDPEEDRRRHTVTDGGVVVVTAEDEPLIGAISEEALEAELVADRGGAIV